jgi:hypothetical protein
MLKTMRKRLVRTVPVSVELRRAVPQRTVSPGAALAALIVSNVLMCSILFPMPARAQARTASSNAGGPGGSAQTGAATEQGEEPQELDGWERRITKLPKDRKPAPAPRRDFTGIWDPGMTGIGMLGAKAMPEDGKPEHQLPYTALGLEMLKRTKPNGGARAVLPQDTNDPVFVHGDPQGMPREDLYELRTLLVYQSPQNMAILYQFNEVWRVIWTDGRELPENPEPRWFGYSVGKWVDDYTLVVQTSGMNEKTWVDRAGRPHSADLRVEERFHRPDRDHLELTVTIDDPKMYSRPWVALDKFVFELQAPSFDVHEMIWSPSEYEEYNRLLGLPTSRKDP